VSRMIRHLSPLFFVRDADDVIFHSINSERGLRKEKGNKQRIKAESEQAAAAAVDASLRLIQWPLLSLFYFHAFVMSFRWRRRGGEGKSLIKSPPCF